MKTIPAITCLLILIGSCNYEKPAEQISANDVVFTVKEFGTLCSEAATDIEWYLNQSKAPLFSGLDVLDFPITTSKPEAQQYFNQGLMLAYGFNHAEAARSFYEAIRIDPDCAMCQWGFSYVLGPNYNAGMEPDNYQRAFGAIQKAIELSKSATAVEKALIQAMSERYVEKVPDDRSHLDLAYSEALEAVYNQYPSNTEIAALYAESLMDLHPWDLYDASGHAKEWTPGILEALDRVLALNPDHPGAHHLYIHAVEASAAPEKGYESAQKFDQDLVPGSGHLVHMPSHIYIRTGDYNKGLLANIRAVSVDSSYLSQCHAQGAYPLAYYPHNMHFIAATAAYAGNSYWAAIGANAVSDHAHRTLMSEPGWGTLQHYYAMPYYVAVKFAKWDDILKMENKNKNLKYPQAIRHFARGMAYIGKDQMASAHQELKQLMDYVADETLKEVTIWDINNVHTLLQIGSKVLNAEILAKEKKYNQSITLLKEAIEIEDDLQYQEPTDWLLPVRHHLGAVLLEAGKPKDAIEVYKDDLLKLPRNGWALQGLENAYDTLDLKDLAAFVRSRIDEAFSEADLAIDGSRIW